MMRPTLLLLAILATIRSSAQLWVVPAYNNAQAAIDHLQGANVSIDSAYSQTIDPLQVGIFSDSTASLGLDTGLVICTGVCYGVMGPNYLPNSTVGGGNFGWDPDLMTMSLLYPGSLGDSGIIVLYLVPYGDTLTVRYVFGSEEYDEYACSDKDDRVGLFLSGPGIAGPFSNAGINMATLPASGLPLTVNTLNRGIAGSNGSPGMCAMNLNWELDTVYYINNDFGLATQLDGYTVVMTATAVVMPGATYVLKIAIADVNDANYDSAIFLPVGAISSNALSTGIDATPAGAHALWLDQTDRSLQVKGFHPANGPVLVEAFDPTGRLLQTSVAAWNGVAHHTRLSTVLSGVVIIRATQAQREIVERVVVR